MATTCRVMQQKKVALVCCSQRTSYKTYIIQSPSSVFNFPCVSLILTISHPTEHKDKFEMESLPLHRWPRAGDMLAVCKSIHGFTCLSEMTQYLLVDTPDGAFPASRSQERGWSQTLRGD